MKAQGGIIKGPKPLDFNPAPLAMPPNGQKSEGFFTLRHPRPEIPKDFRG